MAVINTSFDLAVVALSVIIAVLASFTALDLAGRVQASSGRARRAWLAAAAVAMGGGIWSMHFVAMLAFELPMPVTYNSGLTVLSFVVAVVVTGVGFRIVARQQLARHAVALAGLFMGA